MNESHIDVEDAERQVISCGLINPQCLVDVFTRITLEDVYVESHRRILGALKAMCDRGADFCDDVLLIAELRERGDLAEIGDPPFVDQLIQDIVSKGQIRTDHVVYYAAHVRTASDRRKLVSVAKEIVAGVRAVDDVHEVVGKAEQGLFAVSATGVEHDLHIGTAVDAAMRAILERMDTPGGLIGLETGLTGLDNLTRGLQKSRLMVVAARTGCGKTALTCNIALHVAKAARRRWDDQQATSDSGPPQQKGGVLFFSLEMPKEELAERLFCLHGRIAGDKMARGRLDEVDQFSLNDSGSLLKTIPLLVDDTPGRTMMQIESVARMEHRRNGIELIVVDHIGIIQQDPGKRLPAEPHAADVSRRLKVLATTLKVPVIALCQMNRDFEKREDKRPRLSDLRSSGAIEQDADVVVFINRPELYDSSIRPGEADLVVAKNRSGMQGVAEMVWRPHFMQFADKATSWEGEE